MSGTLGKRYTFGEWQLDTRLYELRCAGKPLKLEPKVYDVLLYLIEHRDRVVSTQELMEQLWSGQFIGDAALVRCVVVARRLIGDDGRAQQCIKTLRNRGYRFVATVEEVIHTTAAEAVQVVPTSPPPPRQPIGPPLAERAYSEQRMVSERPRLCPQCQHENSVTASFCGTCGTRLISTCAACGHLRSPQALYCTACGKTFTHSSPIMRFPASAVQDDLPAVHEGMSRSLVVSDAEPEAERRHLTMLFCDVINATTLAVRLDPEVYHQVIGAYHAVCVKVIERFDGHIAQYLGDGVLVYFGYPRAHEDDGQRAVRTGLGIIEALKPLQTRLQQEQAVDLAVRVGIHTGLVVVGDIGEGARHERLALGEAPNLAARLQALAPPGTVLISATTEQLVHGWFACETLGNQPLKGFPEPVPVYRVLAESGIRSRLDLDTASGLTPLVGRGQEVELLLERWEHIKEGLGQVVVLSGEAGIGKSRLVHAVQDGLVGESYVKLECRGSPYAQHSALYPIIDLARRLLQWQRDEPPDATLGKLEAVIGPYGMALPEVIPLLASLLSLPLPKRYAPLQLTPQRQKQKTLEVILTLLLAEAARQPVLFIVEDVHWIDPSTLDLLTLLVDQGPTARILTLLTGRPEFHPPWGFRAHVTTLTLGRLTPRQVEQMIDRMTEGKDLPPEVCRQVVAKTDGVPLFVEELTKMVLESGLLQERNDRYELIGPLPSLAIPTTLHDSLMARLDRFTDAKEIAQLGATLGRSFPYELLRAVSPWDEERFEHALAQLVDAELLHQRGVEPHVTYVFKHALIQETAYQSLLRSKRRQYHRQTVHVLEQRFPDIAGTRPELLAYHCTEAGLIEQAIPYWQQAGQRALERSADREAITHFARGLELLKTLSETPERIQQEITLQLALGSPLLMLKGHTSAEVEHAYTRAYELAQQIGDTPQRFAVLISLWRFYFSQARLHQARSLAEQCFGLAQHLQNVHLLEEAHLARGSTLLHLGEHLSARSAFEQGIALYDVQHSRPLTFSRGTDPGVVCLSRAAWTLWMLGYAQQAVDRIREALALARQVPHAYSLGLALQFAGLVHQCRREVPVVLELAEAEIALSDVHGFVEWLESGKMLRAWAIAHQGAAEEGIAQFRPELDSRLARGNNLGKTPMLARLAEIYAQAGQIHQGLSVLTEAMAAVHANGERHYEAELYRLKGDLLLQSGGGRPRRGGGQVPAAEAETNFLRARAIARQQQTKALELRAAMSLARLWQAQDRRSDACQLLTEVYSWFTEGFDTQDLQEAQALLAALA